MDKFFILSQAKIGLTSPNNLIYNWSDVFKMGGVKYVEDISAEKKTETKGTRLYEKDAYR